jgi:hypothetical protein
VGHEESSDCLRMQVHGEDREDLVQVGGRFPLFRELPHREEGPTAAFVRVEFPVGLVVAGGGLPRPRSSATVSAFGARASTIARAAASVAASCEMTGGLFLMPAFLSQNSRSEAGSSSTKPLTRSWSVNGGLSVQSAGPRKRKPLSLRRVLGLSLRPCPQFSPLL